MTNPITTLIAATRTSPRKYEVTLRVLSRPDRVAEWDAYYRQIAHEFAFRHGAHIVSLIDIDPRPFSETTHLTFTIKAWHHPERHQALSDFFSHDLALAR